MKHKNIIFFILLVFFLYPVAVFSGEWFPMTSGTTNPLLSVWGSSGSDVFAVGAKGTILHYNGSTWSSMVSGTTSDLLCVWGSSGSDVFAVGYDTNNYTGTILHYNGSTWSTMISGTTNNFYGVWGSSGSDVFAVGYDGNILHYNGNNWSPMTSGTTNPLRGVWGSSGSDVYAVGIMGTILHYGGTVPTTTVPVTTTTSIPSGTTTTVEPCTSEAIYGENSEETELLRYIRDNVLSQTPEGQELIRLYYELSPVIVEMMEEDEEFKAPVKEMIDGVLPLIK
jgi:hypothetical protein